MRRVPVRLGGRSYTIRIAAGILERAGDELRGVSDAERVFLVSDTAVHRLYGVRVECSLRARSFRVSRFLLRPGEKEKTLGSVERIYDALLAAGADRRTLLAALGGGVVGDTAGFAAATWHRGIPFAQIPTTLLAQIDASIGGKTGVDLPSGKNLVGAFHQPAAVLADPACLATLPAREYRSGLAEAVKYGMIRDARFFHLLERNAEGIAARDPALLERVIERCCRIKAEYVAADEEDRTGKRAELNYGHTFGHAVETAAGYGSLRHGEAVAIGMAAASHVSMRLGLLDPADRERLLALLQTFGLPVGGVQAERGTLFRLLLRDKKTEGGRLRIVLTKGIGLATLRPSVPEPLILEALGEVCTRFSGRRRRRSHGG
ncbi:MAG: 3-dehydroquinate synthase [Candidatus Eisenbacteria bacterium]|nr:3-dehydroquinate synthase [Candidatus Eisenbacteria bacterium]